jgi:ferrous iron transport protein B
LKTTHFENARVGGADGALDCGRHKFPVLILCDFTALLVTTAWGLPKESVMAIVIGFLRKDVAMGMLAPLGLSNGQLVTGSVVLAMFFPCIATFTVLARELGAVNMLKSAGIMIVSSLAVGGILNLIL